MRGRSSNCYDQQGRIEEGQLELHQVSFDNNYRMEMRLYLVPPIIWLGMKLMFVVIQSFSHDQAMVHVGTVWCGYVLLGGRICLLL